MQVTKQKSLQLFILLFFCSLSYSQSKISPAQYKSAADSLENIKANLLNEKNELKSDIENLSSELTDLENKVTLALRDLYIAKYGEKDGVNVSYGRVWKGMTEEMLRDSWGKPDKIEKNVENWGTFTQWYYGDVTYFFRDGVLTEGDEKE
jgi:predicted transport protein